MEKNAKALDFKELCSFMIGVWGEILISHVQQGLSAVRQTATVCQKHKVAFWLPECKSDFWLIKKPES